MRAPKKHNTLFARLLLYFIVVMLVPVVSLYLNSIAEQERGRRADPGVGRSRR